MHVCVDSKRCSICLTNIGLLTGVIGIVTNELFVKVWRLFNKNIGICMWLCYNCYCLSIYETISILCQHSKNTLE